MECTKYPEVEITVRSCLPWTICCNEVIDPYNGQTRFAGRLAAGETKAFKTTNTLVPIGRDATERIEKYPVYYKFQYYDSPYGLSIEMIPDNNGKTFELYPDPEKINSRLPDILARIL